MSLVYEGYEPYIFISYAHKDKDEVLDYIQALQQRGFRIWYDNGIQAGSEWPQTIATHLRKCACVISFVSENFVDSHNCRRELAYSQELKIPQLSVFINDLKPEELPDGMHMQMTLNQSLFRENYDTDDAFVAAVAEAPMLQECRGDAPTKTQTTQNTDTNRKRGWLDKYFDRVYQRTGGTTQRQKKEHWTRLSKALVWIVVLMELAYIPISTNLVPTMMIDGYTLFTLALILIGVHVTLAMINLLLRFYVRGGVIRAGVDQKPLRDARYYMGLATLASVVVPTISEARFLMEYPHFMTRFYFHSPYLSAIGNAAMLNLCSALTAALLYMIVDEIEKRKK